jgi:hypothetical protein
MAVGSPLTLNSGSTSVFEVDTNNPGLTQAMDLVNVSNPGVLSISTGATLNFTHVAGTPLALPVGTKLTLFSYTTLDTTSGFGNFAGKPEGFTGLLGANEWKIAYQDTVAGVNFQTEALANGSRFVTITVVPEASGMLLGSLVCLVIGITVGGRKLLLRRAAA